LDVSAPATSPLLVGDETCMKTDAMETLVDWEGLLIVLLPSLVTLTHQSVTKTTFLLYFAVAAGMTAACDAMGAVSIIGRWKPFG
jgi:hypothetical protein